MQHPSVQYVFVSQRAIAALLRRVVYTGNVYPWCDVKPATLQRIKSFFQFFFSLIYITIFTFLLIWWVMFIRRESLVCLKRAQQFTHSLFFWIKWLWFCSFLELIALHALFYKELKINCSRSLFFLKGEKSEEQIALGAWLKELMPNL